MADLSQLLGQLLGLREEEETPPARRGRGLFGARIDPQVTQRLSRDFQGDGVQQATSDFQGGFNDMAVNARQALPRNLVTDMAQSGVPGWQGMGQARGHADELSGRANAIVSGLQPPATLPMMQGYSVSQLQPTMMPPEAPYGRVDYSSPQMQRRGLEPPSAPQRSAPAPYSMEDEAWLAAQERAREATRLQNYDAISRVPRPDRPLLGEAVANSRGRRDRTGGGAW